RSPRGGARADHDRLDCQDAGDGLMDSAPFAQSSHAVPRIRRRPRARRARPCERKVETCAMSAPSRSRALGVTATFLVFLFTAILAAAPAFAGDPAGKLPPDPPPFQGV